MSQNQKSPRSSFLRWLFAGILLGAIAIIVAVLLPPRAARDSSHRIAFGPNTTPMPPHQPSPTPVPADAASRADQASVSTPAESNGPVPERRIIASAWKDETMPELAAFAEWAQTFLAATAGERAGLMEQGIELAKARRAALGDLIESDPRRALAAAVPMAVRQQLPAAIVELLEERVSGYGDLYRISTFDPPPGTRPSFDYARVGDAYYYAFRYGQRAGLFELKGQSLQGVAVDKRLAIADSPIQMAEVGQTLAGRTINEVCLVSGDTVVTPGEGTVSDADSAPAQVGDQLLGFCAPVHVAAVEAALQNLEADGRATTTNGGLDLELISREAREGQPFRPMAYGGAPGSAWPGQPSTNLTYGNKRAIVYRVQMQNWTPFPSTYTEAYCTNTILGNQCTICYGGQLTKTVSNQLYEFSWGKVVITQAVATPVLQLPKTRDQYTNDYWGPVLQDAKVAAAAAGFDTNVDFHVIVHSGLQAPNLNACAWGGGGAVWVNECWSVGVLVHEFGHVFGLPHANGWDITDQNVWSPTRTHVEYDDLTDPMGQGSSQQRNHYNSFFKYYLRWYPGSLVINVTNSGLYRVYQFDDISAPLTNPMALLIRHDSVSSYWVALRGNTTSGNYGNAAQIHEVQNNRNDTHLLDFNSPDANNSNGGLNVGQSYYDPAANLTLQTVAIGGTAPLRWMDFNVVIGDAPVLRAHYRLEGDAQDSSGNGFHGTANGGIAFAPGRVHAHALALNGVDSFVEAPRSVSNDFSIAFWVRTTATGGAGQWFNGLGLVDASAGPQTNGFGVALIGNRAAFGVGGPDTTIISTTPINNGQWHHVAATRSKVTGELKLYVDGTLQATAAGPATTLDAAAALRIGSLQTGNNFFAGEIDDVRIFNYPIGLSEVQALATMPSAPHAAGTLYVDLRAHPAMVGVTVWSNQAAFGNFSRVGFAGLVASVAGSGVPGVTFSGSGDAYQGPNSVADLEGSSDRSIEVWAYNPALANEETMVSWGHRGSNRRQVALNFGSNSGFGAVTHYGDDMGWGTPPPANAWHHLVYTYSAGVARVYVNGVLRTTKTLALNTFPNEPINLGCQRDSANGTRSFYYSGFLNAVRVHGAALTPQQVLANYYYGMWTPAAPPGAPGGLTADVRYNKVRLRWGVASGGASSYVIKRAATSGGPYATLATVNAGAYDDTNVVNGAVYYYVVAAGNFFGQSANSGEVSATAIVTPMPAIAGALHVDLRATDPTAGSPTWLNHGALGDFTEVGSPVLVANIGGRPGVLFNGSGDAYAGPVTVPDIEGGDNRTIEVWAYNPALASEETTVSWGHRGTTRRNLGFNFGNHATWGAVTHYGDDLGWGGAPTAGAWHHLVYVSSNNVVSVYADGVLRATRTLGGALDTFPGDVINLACQRESNGARGQWFSGYLNTVRVHGGILSPQQIQANYLFGPWMPNVPPSLVPPGDRTIVAGARLTVTNVAVDPNGSQQTLTFTLLEAPGTATLGATNGIFSWRALLADAGSTNLVRLKVADNGSPILSATQQFNVMVVSPVSPVLAYSAFSNGAFRVSVSGDAGPDYTVLTSTNLLDWVTLLTTNSPAMPFVFQDPAAGNQRFYKIMLGP